MSALVTTTYKNTRILVADDEPGMAHLIERMVVSRLGSETVTAENGDAVLALVKEQPFDAVVVDMLMPGVHGLDLVRELRSVRPEAAVVVMTGHAREFPYVEAIQAGAQDFIHKPFSAMELEAKLVRIFKEQSLYRDLRLAEEKYRSLFELSGEGMLLLDVDSDHIADVNQAFCDLCGSDMVGLTGRPLHSLFEGVEAERLSQVLKFAKVRGKCAVSDLTLRDRSGRILAVDVSITHIRTGEHAFVFLGFRDITEKREVEQRLAEVAQKDELTGLFNRRSFTHRIEGALRNARTREEDLALILLDVDNFKTCNDTHGHQTGDQLLIHVGEVLKKGSRQNSLDKGFRCGGDEFAMILQGTPKEQAIQVAERVQHLFSEGETYGTTLSIGIACLQHDTTSEHLIQRADRALYRAKAKGKNAVEVD